MNKLVENFFSQEEKIFGPEDLKNIIYKEYKNKLQEAPKKSVATASTKTEERTLKLPKLQISENWGKLKTIERTELERIVRSATSANSNVFEKLQMIEKQMNSLSSGQLGKIKKPQRILSQIMILETMNRLFKSFQPSPAGFINEALLSVFYGGIQTPAGEANVKKDIGDVTDPDGTPVSIKTKISGKLKVDGSIENLYSSINSSRTGKVYFDIYEKITESGGETGDHVGKLIVSRFVIDAKNVNTFLGKNYFSIDDKGKLIPRAKFKVAGKEIDEGRKRAKLTDQEQKIYNNIINSPSIISPEQLQKMTSRLDSEGVNVILQNIDNYLNTLTDENKKEILNKQKSILAGIEVSKRKLDKSAGGMEREFEVGEREWKNFAVSQGTLRNIEINFSDAQINKILQQALLDLDQQIVEIFNSLDGFSNSINSYLTSEESGRTQQGDVALQYAKKLEPQTQKVIKTVSSDENA